MSSATYDDRSLTTLSLTPRINMEHRLFGLPGKAIAGVDLYQSYFLDHQEVDRGDAAAHRYGLEQRTLAGYLQEAVSVRPDTDLSLGLRLQDNDVAARDRFDPSAPNNGNFSTAQGQPLNKTDNQYAFHLGLDHRLTEATTLFGRIGHSFRLPTVDERVGASPWGTATNFALKTQTSNDVETGVRGHWGPVSLQSSVYLMELRDELHFSPVTYTNINLDPTQRYGMENSGTWQITRAVRLKGGLTYTRAQFTAGTWKGNDVPLVSRWTGTGGVSWNVWDKLAVFDADVRYVGDRRFDNDQANVQPMIPSHTLVDLRIGGEAGWARYSLAVQNLFDYKYFDYGIASTFTYGSYNAYPMPGRTVMGRFGVSF
jgi:iron complex outermembrane receptor protein